MRNIYPILLIILLSGCASLNLEQRECFPFVASMSARGVYHGNVIGHQGALVVTSAEVAEVQIYGPFGLAAGSVKMQDGCMKITDMWGNLLEYYKFPANDFSALLAGQAPRRGYLLSRRNGDGRRIYYSWGRLELDQAGRPLVLNIDAEPEVRLDFGWQASLVRVAFSQGSDKIILDLNIVEGGCW